MSNASFFLGTSSPPLSFLGLDRTSYNSLLVYLFTARSGSRHHSRIRERAQGTPKASQPCNFRFDNIVMGFHQYYYSILAYDDLSSYSISILYTLRPPKTLHLNQTLFSQSGIRKIRNDIFLTKHIESVQNPIVHS